MRKLFLIALSAFMAMFLMGASSGDEAGASSAKQYIVAGVSFYNLENLFDTINNNDKYDLEFSPEGARMWNSDKYWKKISNLARAIVAMSTPETPMGPGVIGISEVENIGVVEDLVRKVDERLVEEGREPWNLRIVHHDSPDRRGIDVALLYNPLFFSVENVTNHRLVIPDEPDFLTRDQLCVTGSMLDVPMSFIVNHWPSRLGGQEQSSYLREAAGRLSKNIADSLWSVNPAQGIIMMGDLNDDQIVVSGNLVEGIPDGLQYWKATVHNHEFLRTKGGRYHNYPHRTFSGRNFLNGYSDHFPTEIFLIKEI